MDDADRTRALRRMKAVASALLLVAALVFVLARSRRGDGAAWGYVEAAAEAAMVGALADWFAVTALFRRPLGLPIPHTAIIPERKDEIGRSLGAFVEGNFMSHEVIGERVRNAQVARRVGAWLAEPANAARAADAVADALNSALKVLDDSEVRAGLERLVETRLRDTPVAPLAGRAIEAAVEGGQHSELFDTALRAARSFLDDNRDMLREMLDRESPWWVPEPIDKRIFAKIFGGVQRFLADVAADPRHPMRARVEKRIVALAERLQTDPAMRARGEELKDELLDRPEVRAWLASLWDETKRALVDATARPGSELRHRTAVTAARLGQRVVEEPELQARLDAAVERFVEYVVDNYRSEVSRLIEATIEKWDGAATSRKLELQVGRDLQFIRINGTIVGGLAGVAIHAASQTFF